MNYLNTNLECLKKSNNGIYNFLKEKISDINFVKECNNKFKIVNTRDDMRTIEVITEDDNLMRLNSTYSPAKEAKRWMAKYKSIDRITSVIMCGYGLGFFFKELSKYIDDSAFIFDYEPDIKLFLFIIDNFDITSFLSDARMILYIEGINEKNMYTEICSKINWAMLSTQVVISHPIYDRLYRDKYKWFMETTGKCRYALELAGNTSVHHAKEFTVNAIKNLEFIKKSNYIGDLVGKIDKDVPVIIVSAGPSLDKNVDELKKAEKKSIILATDTAVRTLIAHNVYFDAIVSVDGTKPVGYLNDLACRYKCIFTVADANYDILKMNESRKIWINGNGYIGVIYRKNGYKFPEYLSGGSVATAAFWIAEMLSTKTIILVGQDLAYDGEYTHAGRMVEKLDDIVEKDIYVEGISGLKVRSRWDWVRYLQWFENAITMLDKNVEVIDATEGGARIAGTKIMTLSDTVTLYCKKKVDFKNIIVNIKPNFAEERYESVYYDIFNILKEFDIIYEAANKGEDAAKKIEMIVKQNKISNNIINFELEQIKKSNMLVQNQEVYLLLDEYISEDIVEWINILSKRYDNECAKLYDFSKGNIVLFQALKKAIIDLKPIVEKLLEKF